MSVLIVSSTIPASTAQVAPGACGPIDLTIALDDTGSMGGAINNIKAELPTIISTANTASGNDLRVGYLTFKDDVLVHNNLTTNISAVMDSINATFASGGAGGPEASDEAKNTSVNNLPAGPRPDPTGFIGTQTGDYSTPYRASATKIVVLITDAPPGGFNDAQDPADEIALNTTHPNAALAKGIKVSDIFVPTSGDYGGQAALLSKDANVTGGVFITTAANGSGTGAAITSIIEKCGGAPPTGKPGKITGWGLLGPKTSPEKRFKIWAYSGFLPQGTVEVRDYPKGLTIKSTKIDSVLTDLTSMTGTITGKATVNGAGSYGFIVKVEDKSILGNGADVFDISLPDYGGYTNSGVLSAGDINIIK